MMQSGNSTDLLTSDTPGSRRTTALLTTVAGLSLLLTCLLSSPSQFSEAHRQDESLLKRVVAALALVGPEAQRGLFPTAKGVEIRYLFFYVGAALLTIIGGIRLISSGARPMLSRDDFWNWRERAGSPLFWWAVLLVTSLVTSWFSPARDVSLGQAAIRLMFAAWWWPIAALLLPSGVRRLSAALLLAVGLCALMGLWYFSSRSSPGWFGPIFSLNLPDARLEYPIGNALLFGACLLPAVFVSLGLGIDSFTKSPASPPAAPESGVVAEKAETQACKCKRTGALALILFPVLLVALALTQSRSSAWIGLGAGVVAVAFMSVGKKARPVVLLAGLLVALVGVWKVQGLREVGEMGQRAHSIRTRLNHEWPYAINLFMQKPVGGHGEGCYTMLAPQFAREEQLDEPSTLAFNERWWYTHAHNEYLELLADLGIIGAGAFVVALVLTLFYAVRYCDRARENPAERPYRFLVIALGGALFAMMIEECSSTAMRNTAFPPIFLTSWALLWALIRGERRVGKQVAAGDERLNTGVLRGAGVVAVSAGIALGYLGVQDWRGARASHEAQQSLTLRDLETAIAQADFAGDHLLDPFQQLTARMFGVSARTAAFTDSVASGDKPTDEDIRLATEAWTRLDSLGRAAPRFLNLSRMAADLSLGLARAHQARGQQPLVEEYVQHYRLWLIQSVKDDPFNTKLVEQLWASIPDPIPLDRLRWLRGLMRRGEVDESTRAMAQDLFRRLPVAVNVLNDLGKVAEADLARPYEAWDDVLTPETFRIAAMLKDWAGQPADAEKLAKMAQACYEKAGPALFAAHSAAIREAVTYGLHVDPTGRTDELLRELVRAHVKMEGKLGVEGEAALAAPLPHEKGVTRAQVLAAAGRDKELAAQLELLRKKFGEESATAADIYYSLAEEFRAKPQFGDLALQWALKARELNEKMPVTHYTLLGLYLQRGEEKNAEESARRFIELFPDRDRAYEALQNMERGRPGSAMWGKLRADYPDFPELPLETTTTQPATMPASRPTTGPGAGGP